MLAGFSQKPNVLFVSQYIFRSDICEDIFSKSTMREKEDVVVLPENSMKKDEPLKIDSNSKIVRMDDANVENNVETKTTKVRKVQFF
jgi:hypothetical protein